MKILLISIFVFVSFAGAANAQRCGQYRVDVIVLDESDKPIDKSDVQLGPILRNETYGKNFRRDKSDRSKFSIQFLEGQGMRDFHKLIVSADGYQTAENEIKFGSCDGPYIKVRLPRKNSERSPVWDFKDLIRVETLDADGNYIGGVKVTIKKGGKIVTEELIEYFGSGFSLPNGVYVFRFEKEGYLPKEMNADLRKIGEVAVQVKLEKKK